jgi:hypothetical protein
LRRVWHLYCDRLLTFVIHHGGRGFIWRAARYGTSQLRRFKHAPGMSASLIGRLGSSTFRPSPLQCRCRSRARASLRNRHQGPSTMGFEDEVEQSLPRLAIKRTADPSGHANSRPQCGGFVIDGNSQHVDDNARFFRHPAAIKSAMANAGRPIVGPRRQSRNGQS